MVVKLPPGEGLERFCDFSERFLTDEGDRPLVVEGFQRQILSDYFSGARETVVLLSKKNGKTSLFAALALWHVITEPFADVAILAASRDQAGKLLSQLTGYIKRSAELRQQLRITQRVVHCDRTDGKVAVLAADADTLDGWGGTLALVDELARHKSAENFGLLRDGLGPREGQLIAFSTAGDDERSALGQIRASAQEMDGFAPDPENPRHKRVRTPEFSFHEWSLDAGDDTEDMALVLQANPASWLDETEMRKRHDSPSMQRWQWQRFTCGQWVAGEQSAINPKEWGECADRSLQIPAGAACVVIGGDLAYTRDCTAFIAAWKSPEGLILLDDPVILEPPGDGSSIDVEDMVSACHEYAERYPGCAFSFDEMAGGQQLLQRLEREIPDSEFISYPKQSGKLCGAAMNFAELISTRKLRHPDQPKLTEHVLAAAARFVGERWRFAKPRGKDKKIDGVIAASIAAELAGSAEPPRRSIYETQDVVWAA
jgi:phage terminase large subunit-like protein